MPKVLLETSAALVRYATGACNRRKPDGARSLSSTEWSTGNSQNACGKGSIAGRGAISIYSRRMGIIEPVFADITHCKGMDRFTLRGKVKVNTQWLLYCLVHNIGKIAGSGALAEIG